MAARGLKAQFDSVVGDESSTIGC
eukprot:COSAG01_NODE_24014_length_793_cov_4.583573_1_plen_23_part_10